MSSAAADADQVEVSSASDDDDGVGGDGGAAKPVSSYFTFTNVDKLVRKAHCNLCGHGPYTLKKTNQGNGTLARHLRAKHYQIVYGWPKQKTLLECGVTGSQAKVGTNFIFSLWSTCFLLFLYSIC